MHGAFVEGYFDEDARLNPLHFFHLLAVHIVRAFLLRQIYDSARRPKWIRIFEQLRHNDLFQDDTETIGVQFETSSGEVQNLDAWRKHRA